MSRLADSSGDLLAPYNTFSGTDMVASLLFPDTKPIVLGDVSTLSYSIYRAKAPVVTLGRINVRGFTKGPRTVAGTIVFTVFDRHVVNQIRTSVDLLRQAGRLKSDELPPFDLILTGANEFGSAAAMRIYGVTVIEEGMTISVEDIFTENVWQYQARDIRLLDNYISEDGQMPVTEEPARTGVRDGADMSLGMFSPENLDMAKAAQQYDGQIASIIQQRAGERQQRQDIEAAREAMMAAMLGKAPSSGTKTQAPPKSPTQSLQDKLGAAPDEGRVHFVVRFWGKSGVDADGDGIPENVSITSGITKVHADHTTVGLGRDTGEDLEQVPGTNAWIARNVWTTSINEGSGTTSENEPHINFIVDTNSGTFKKYKAPVNIRNYQGLKKAQGPTHHLDVYLDPVASTDGSYALDQVRKSWGSGKVYTDNIKVKAGSPCPSLALHFDAVGNSAANFPERYQVAWYYALSETGSANNLGGFQYAGSETTLIYGTMGGKVALGTITGFKEKFKTPGTLVVARAALFKPGVSTTYLKGAVDHWDFFIIVE